jgi:hypothetical protein
MSDKKMCQDRWAALACDGDEYNDNVKNISKRKEKAKKLVASHPECEKYVTEHTSCALVNPAKGGGRKSRKNRKSRKSRKGRKGTRRH